MSERIEMLHPDAARRLGVPVQQVRLVFQGAETRVARDCYSVETGERLGDYVQNEPNDPEPSGVAS